MRIRTIVCCIAAFFFLPSASAVPPMSGVNFANSGAGWSEPWYGIGTSNDVGLFIWHDCTGTAIIPAGSKTLNGTGFTAELWGGPEGSAESSLQFLERTTFRTGAAAGLVSPRSFVPVPFALPGQRVALQMRVYSNAGGTVTSWSQAMFNFSIVTGTSKVFTSEPLGDTPVSLRGMGSYCVTTDFFRLPVPVVSLSTGERLDPIFGPPSQVKLSESFWPIRSIIAGDTVTLRVEVPNPANSVTWSHNGEILPGQADQSLVLSNIQPAQSGEYSVHVTASVGSLVFSRTNIVRVDVAPSPLLEAPVRDVSGAFAAIVRGVKKRRVAVESSTNLQDWVRGPTNWIGGQTFCTGLTVTNPPLFGPQLFYRAVVLP